MTTFLGEGHRADLVKSGLSPETIGRCGFYSAPEPEVRDLLGYGIGPGLVIPYWTLAGERMDYVRIKADTTPEPKRRYRAPKNAPNQLYTPPLVAWSRIAGDTSTTLWITEGEKKSAAACQAGLPCLALAGVWSWKTRLAPEDATTAPLPGLDAFTWRGRQVIIAYDSDYATKPEVRDAAQFLARELSERGALVSRVPLPDEPTGEKNGLDDFLVRYGVDQLCQLELIPFPPLPGTPREPFSIEVIDVVDLLAREFPSRHSLVGDGLLIRQGIAMLGGIPRIGKSLLCSNLALCRALDRSWLDFSVLTGTTLYVQAEVPEMWLQRRFGAMLAALGHPEVPRDRLFTVTKRGLFLDGHTGREALTTILDQCAQRTGNAPDLTILDPIARFYAGDENNQREVGRLVETLDGLVEKYQTAFLIPHHPGKPNKGDGREGGARFRGLAGLWAASDATWWLEKGDDDGVTLTFDDLRHAIPPAPLFLKRTPGLWLEAATMPTDERLDVVARDVAQGGKTWTQLCAAVMADLEVSKATAARLIEAATRAGLIAKDPQNIYRVGPGHTHNTQNNT